MTHLSENVTPLRSDDLQVPGAQALARLRLAASDVCLFVLPYGVEAAASELHENWLDAFCQFAAAATPEATICVFASPPLAASLYSEVEAHFRLQLWIAVKLKEPVAIRGGLTAHHAALLVMTKYRGPLRHTKTRIAYTYCPYCDRTTKDYGGKKHTYNSYGTLVSDVWRDIDCEPDLLPKSVLRRLQDLFGQEPYRRLCVVDLRGQDAVTSPLHQAQRRINSTENNLLPSELACSLVQGDCLEALQRLPDNSVDFCFADPPYNLQKGYDSWADGLDIIAYFTWCDKWLHELARVLRPGRTLAVLNIPLWAIRHFTFLKTRLRFQSWIVWEGLSLPVRMIMPAHYSILCFSKGRPRIPPGLVGHSHTDLESRALSAQKEFFCSRVDCVRARRAARQEDFAPLTDLWWDIHRLKHNSRRVDHPCQLPPALMHRLIALFTQDKEMVLDPFNGCGTTTLAAAQLGRRYLGIELSEAYHSVAQRRHRELAAGLDPFRKTRAVPGAKNSRVRRLPKRQYAVPKKKLQLDVRRIAQALGRLPTREDVKREGKYPIEYYDEYFISWGEVCAAARNDGMQERRGTRRSDGISKDLLFEFP